MGRSRQTPKLTEVRITGVLRSANFTSVTRVYRIGTDDCEPCHTIKLARLQGFPPGNIAPGTDNNQHSKPCGGVWPVAKN